LIYLFIFAEMAAEGVSLAPMSCVLGSLSQADGSALFHHANTSIMAAAYGPVEVKMAKELADRATVEIVCKPKTGLSNCADKFRERHINNLLQATVLVKLHPRSSIAVILQELENQGGYLAACVNAACLALLDAGVNMRYLVASVTCEIHSDGSIHLAPLEKPITDSEVTAELTFAFSETDTKVMDVVTSGKFSQAQHDTCLSLCREASKQVFRFYRESLNRKLSKSV
jgi:exosome complex component RRP46